MSGASDKQAVSTSVHASLHFIKPIWLWLKIVVDLHVAVLAESFDASLHLISGGHSSANLLTAKSVIIFLLADQCFC